MRWGLKAYVCSSNAMGKSSCVFLEANYWFYFKQRVGSTLRSPRNEHLKLSVPRLVIMQLCTKIEMDNIVISLPVGTSTLTPSIGTESHDFLEVHSKKETHPSQFQIHFVEQLVRLESGTNARGKRIYHGQFVSQHSKDAIHYIICIGDKCWEANLYILKCGTRWEVSIRTNFQRCTFSSVSACSLLLW